jgi:hypothetical protein
MEQLQGKRLHKIRIRRYYCTLRGLTVARLHMDNEDCADDGPCDKNVAESKQIPQVASHYLGFRPDASPGSDIS